MSFAMIRIIENQYWNHTAAIRIEYTIWEEMQIKRGVRQGCVRSSLLFNVYSECIFREALDELLEGIVINREHLNNVRYTVDKLSPLTQKLNCSKL